MTSAAPEPTGMRKLLRSRLVSVIAIAVAAALVIAAGVVAAIKFWPRSDDTENLAESAPVAFLTSIIPLAAPIVTRGDALPLRIDLDAAEPVTNLQLWDGDRLYYVTTDPGAEVLVDFVPLVAGGHILTARGELANGATSVSAPLQIAVRDRDPSAWTLGPSADPEQDALLNSVGVNSSPGDTMQSLADRLGVGVDQLKPLADPEEQPQSDDAPESPSGPDAPVEPGTPFLAPILTPAKAKELVSYFPTLQPIEVPTVSTSIENCVVRVSIANSDKKWALYASTPLKPGMLRVGDIEAGGYTDFATLPLGMTVFVAYRIGTTPDQLGLDNQPTPPAQVVVPDECISRGWTGDASIVNGVLFTGKKITDPYVYLSIDGKPWVRAPGGQETLLTGNMNDLREWVTQIRFDRADVEVWSSVDGLAQLISEGHFCLKDVPGAQASDGSGSGGSCGAPPGPHPIPGNASGSSTTLAVYAPGEPVSTGPFNIPDPSAIIEQQINDAATALAYADDPLVSQRIDLNSDKEVTLTATITGEPDADRVEFQFSYFPISSLTTTFSPAGTFLVDSSALTTQSNGARVATMKVHPWKWKDTKAELDDTITLAGDGKDLSLDDELAYAVAQQALAEGRNLVDQIYVRAVPYEQGYYKHLPAGAPSRSVLVVMPSQSSPFHIVEPTLSLTPGLDTDAPNNALGGRCADVDLYPDVPKQEYPFGTDAENNAWGFAWNNYKMAYALFPDPEAVYCLDPNASAIRQARAEAEADDCSVGCIILGAVIGFAVGFATGGPVGGLIGAIAGGMLANAAPGAFKAALEALKQFWDLLVQVYNAAYSAVLTLAATLNPVCLGIKAVADSAEGTESTAESVCKAVTKAVTSAAITYFTGLPPSLPPSSTLTGLAQGKLQGLMMYGMDLALGKIGLSCDALSIPAEPETPLPGDPTNRLYSRAANALGSADAAAAIDAARGDDGRIGVCQGITNVVAKKARQQVTEFYGKTIGDLMSLQLPAGMVMTPVADTPPTLHIEGVLDGPAKFGGTCPAIVNAVAQLNANVAIVPSNPDGERHNVLRTYVFRPITTTLRPEGLFGSGNWSGDVTLPILPTDYQWTSNDGMFLHRIDTDPNPDAPYLQVTVDSPCFDSTLVMEVQKYGSALSFTRAFRTDPRTVRYYA